MPRQSIQALTIKAKVHLEQEKYLDAVRAVISAKNEYLPLSPIDTSSTYTIVAEVFESIGAVNMAIPYKRKHCEFVLKSQPSESRFYSLGSMGGMCLKAGLYEEAILYFNHAKKVGVDLGDRNYMYSSYNNLGITYSKKGDIQNAIESYQNGIEIIEKTENRNRQDSLMLAYLSGNLGNLLYKNERLDEAIPLMEKDVRLSKIHGSNFLHHSNAVQLLDILIEANDLSKAKYLLRDLDKTIHTVSSLEIRSKYHKSKSVYLLKKKKSEDGLRHFQLHTVLEDSIKQREIEKQKEFSQAIGEFQLSQVEGELKVQKLENEKTNQDLQIAKNEKRYTSTILIISISSGVILLLLIILTTRRKIRLQQKDAKLLEVEKELALSEQARLDEELKYKNQDLNALVLDMNRRKEFSEEVLLKLRKFSKTNEKEILNQLILFCQQHQNIDDGLEVFQKNLEQLNASFYTKLQERHKLTANEKQLCGMIVLGLSNKEIATVKNVTTQAAKVGRYRLRKTLNLTPEDDIEVYLKTFM